MKYNIFKNLLLGASVVAAMTACDENSWNKDYLDGFEENEITDVRTVELELQATDYAKIAKLNDNILIAKKLDAQNGGGDTYINALAAVHGTRSCKPLRCRLPRFTPHSECRQPHRTQQRLIRESFIRNF